MNDQTGTWAVGFLLGLVLAIYVFWRLAEKKAAKGRELMRLREEQRQRENGLTREIEQRRGPGEFEKESEGKEFASSPVPAELGLAKIIGQENLKRRVTDRLAVVRKNGWQFPHMLISADEGMGRGTVAEAIAAEISGPAGIVIPPTTSSLLDLNNFLMTIRVGSCFVVPDLDSIKISIIEALAHALDAFEVVIAIGKGPGARTHHIPCNKFTMIATCRNERTLPHALLSSVTPEVLDPYSNSELAAIASSQAAALGFCLDQAAALCACRQCGGRPGSTNALLRRVKQYAGIATLSENDFLSILGLPGVNRKATQTGSGLVEDLRSMSGVALSERAGRRVVVQCKRWSETVGEPIVREFYGSMLHAQADAGIFVTTSSFSAQAREFVRQKPITLLDLKSLLDLFLYGGAIESFGLEKGENGASTA